NLVDRGPSADAGRLGDLLEHLAEVLLADGLALHGEVGLGDDADDLLVGVDDGDAAHLVAAQELLDAVEVVFRLDADEIAARHGVAHGQVARLATAEDAEGEVAVGDDADEALGGAALDDGQAADVMALHEL